MYLGPYKTFMIELKTVSNFREKFSLKIFDKLLNPPLKTTSEMSPIYARVLELLLFEIIFSACI